MKAPALPRREPVELLAHVEPPLLVRGQQPTLVERPAPHALAEAHHSGIPDDWRRDIAADLYNLAVADPQVNRTQKATRAPATGRRHSAWSAERVIIAVKPEYELSVDASARWRPCSAAVVRSRAAWTPTPRRHRTAISSDAPPTFSITVAVSDPVTGLELPIRPLTLDRYARARRRGVGKCRLRGSAARRDAPADAVPGR